MQVNPPRSKIQAAVRKNQYQAKEEKEELDFEVELLNTCQGLSITLLICNKDNTSGEIVQILTKN